MFSYSAFIIRQCTCVIGIHDIETTPSRVLPFIKKIGAIASISGHVHKSRHNSHFHLAVVCIPRRAGAVDQLNNLKSL